MFLFPHSLLKILATLLIQEPLDEKMIGLLRAIKAKDNGDITCESNCI